MGKKKGGKKGQADDFDDANSITSTGTYASAFENGQEVMDGQADAFSQAIDDTYESRATTREKAWERMVAMLRSGVRLEDCYQSASTLTSRCVSAIKKGGATEAASAATALALHVLTLGEPNESLFEEVYAELVKAAKQGKGAAVKIAAAEALAVCCFIAAEDEITTLNVMQQLQGLWGKDSAKLRAAALRSWSFLFTSLSSPPATSQLEAQLAALAGLLHDADVDVRAAAGEGLALLYHSCGLGEELMGYADEDWDELDEQDEEPDPLLQDLAPAGPATAAAGAQLQLNGTPSSNGQQQQQHTASVVVNGLPEGLVVPGTSSSKQRREADVMSLGSSVSGLDLVIDRVRDLATNRGDRQRRNKKDRSALKGAFRELRSMLEDGHVPEQKIKLRHGDVLIINTMEGNIMMNYFKRFIAGGFQVHLQGNPFLHSVFGFQPLDERPEKLSALEKRYFRSPSSAASKARSQARKSQRSFKGATGAGDW